MQPDLLTDVFWFRRELGFKEKTKLKGFPLLVLKSELLITSNFQLRGPQEAQGIPSVNAIFVIIAESKNSDLFASEIISTRGKFVKLANLNKASTNTCRSSQKNAQALKGDKRGSSVAEILPRLLKALTR